MEAQLEKLREVQKAAWNKSSEGWKKWDALMMHFLQPMTEEMIGKLNFIVNDHILDVATGTGEPALTIATRLTSGKVTAIDLSEKMLSVAREQAANRGIENFETACCDATEMPFNNNAFDAISCRLGFMFFPDMEMALKEMIRVLKPGGRLCASVWNGPEKNPWISNTMEVMVRRLNLNPPASGAPGAYRCAEKGMMASLFAKAGLKNIDTTVSEGKLLCRDTGEYWNFISEVAAPLAFSNAGESIREEIKSEIISRMKENSSAENICLASSATVICGQKQ
jgi:SAM-dependent methyltransferase